MRFLWILLVVFAISACVVNADKPQKKGKRKGKDRHRDLAPVDESARSTGAVLGGVGGSSSSPSSRLFGGPGHLTSALAGLAVGVGATVATLGARPHSGRRPHVFGRPQVFGRPHGHGAIGGRPIIVGGTQPFGVVNPVFGSVRPPIGAVGPIGPVGGIGSNCRYWCRTPEGAAYCCENANQPTNPFATQIVKPGQCPPVRISCPRAGFSGPPVTCSNDGACNSYDKCCFDKCLGEHVCKPPLPGTSFL